MGSIQTDQQPLLPVENSITPFWRTELHELDSHRSTDLLPADCDILIIGGGYAGIAAAYHLLAGDGPIERKSVVLLEARQACSGATGRNGMASFNPPWVEQRADHYIGGHLRPSVYPRLLYYIEKYGREAAEGLADFEFDHVPAIADLIKKEGIECDFELTRSYDIYTDVEQAEAAKKSYLKLKEMGVAKSTIDDLEWTDSDRAEEVYQPSIQSYTDTDPNPGLRSEGMRRLFHIHRSLTLALQTHDVPPQNHHLKRPKPPNPHPNNSNLTLPYPIRNMDSGHAPGFHLSQTSNIRHKRLHSNAPSQI
jgi:hypothetical protein